MPNWSLPDHIEDVLPSTAMRVEQARRIVLDWLFSHDYQLVITPLVENIDSLLVGIRGDLDTKTLKLTDTLSGRTMGVRADITPQAARIDAHLLDCEKEVRLCYCGPVLHAQPEQPWARREQLQIGAELYGCPSLTGDWESISMACGALRQIGVTGKFIIDLGHAEIFESVVKQVSDPGLVEHIRQALIHQDITTLSEGNLPIPSAVRKHLLALAESSDDAKGLEVIRQKIPAEILGTSLNELVKLNEMLSKDGDIFVRYDLSSLAGYTYHTGIVFDIFSEQSGVVARGGRYDGIGSPFGRNRTAVGFSMDIRSLVENNPKIGQRQKRSESIATPIAPQEIGWQKAVAQLQASKEQIRFIHDEECNSEKRLAKDSSGAWHVINKEKDK